MRLLPALGLVLLAFCRPLAAAPIAVGTGTAGSYTNCVTVTWTDSTGSPRTVWILPGNHRIVRMSYWLGGVQVIDDEVTGYGIGNLTNHGSCGASVTRGGVAGYSASAGLAGANHYIWRSTFLHAMCGSGANWRITNEWMFVTGRDDFLQTVAYDSSDVPAGTNMGEDMRGPYCQSQWVGNGSVPVTGVGWGNNYKFFTTSPFTSVPAGCPYSCSGNMDWVWNTPNTVPFVMEWKDPAKGADVDREYGIIQNQTDAQQDFGGAYYGGGNAPASLPATNSGGPMMECWSAPTQMNCYDSAWSSGRLTWGATYGTFNNNHLNDRGQATSHMSYPINAWSWLHQIGKHSDGKVLAAVLDNENIFKSSLTAATGTVVLSGPRGPGNHVGPSVGSMPNVTYSPAGYDHVHRTWTVVAAAGTADATLTLPGGATLNRPTFAIKSMPNAPCLIRLNGVDQVEGTDVFSSYDAGSQVCWITLNRVLTAGAQDLLVKAVCGSPTPTRTPCAACSPTSTVTATPTYSATSTWTPTPPCTAAGVDDLEDNNTQDAFGGYWYTYAGSSSINPASFAPSAPGYGGSGYCARAYGTANTAGLPSLGAGLAGSGSNLSAYSGFSFRFKGDGQSYRFQIHSLVEGGNYNDYKYDFTPPVGWSLVTIPWASFSHPGWGPAYSLDTAQVSGLAWVPLNNGAFDFSVDDILLSCPGAPSPTATPTPAAGSASPTPTRTPTRTATATPSPSASPSASPTLSPSRTATASASPTGTPTVSPTASPSRTASPSATPTRSASPSATLSATPSFSQSPTETPYAGTPTDSPTPTPSFTGTPSFSASPTASASATPTLSASPTATPSASPSASSTLTVSPTATPSPILTATPVFTLSASPSASPSSTASVTPTATPSATPLWTATATPTPSPVASATSSPTRTATPAGGPTAAPTAGTLSILELKAYPQPNPSQIALRLDGDAERVELRCFSVAETALGSFQAGPLTAGWNRVQLPAGWAGDRGNGLYYLRATAWRGSQRSQPVKPLRVMVLR